MKKKLLGVCITVLVLALIAGSTISYFTDTDSAKNVFTVGNVDIKLYETEVIKTKDKGIAKWVKGDDKVSSLEYADIFPGAVLPKEPTVENIGSEAAYIRINVKLPKTALVLFGVDDLSLLTEEAFGAVCGGYNPEFWNMSKSTIGDDIILKFTADNMLAEGDVLTLFTSITIPGSLTAEQMMSIGDDGKFDMDITADAIQVATFDNATQAFVAFDA